MMVDDYRTILRIIKKTIPKNHQSTIDSDEGWEYDMDKKKT